MDAVLLAGLAGLAVIDSTSIGTLFIPVWLLLAPGGIRATRLLVYLGTIAGFYFVAGLVLVAGGTRAVAAVSDSRPLLIVQFAIGIILFALSFWVERRKGVGALRWRDRAAAGSAGLRALVALALLAALAEVATMLPYLGAIGMVATADLAGGTVAALLAGYCVVMVLPALALRFIPARGLERLNTWMTARGGSLVSWVLGIAGFLIARDAAARLWFPEFMG